jgi:hypothetical protein
MNETDLYLDLFLLAMLILIISSIVTILYINYKIDYMYQLETGCNYIK